LTGRIIAGDTLSAMRPTPLLAAASIRMHPSRSISRNSIIRSWMARSYASFAPGTVARKAHLRDEDEFLHAAEASRKRCHLKPVSMIKPIGAENEHPGYASERTGSDHLVELLRAVQAAAAPGTRW